jgi:hypothetical protein
MPKTFGDRAAAQIKRLHSEFSGQRKGNQEIPGISQYIDDPDVYFAKVPAAGIPARSGNTLGHAECQIYRGKLIDGSEPQRDLEEIKDHDDTSVNRWVHNLCEMTIRGSADLANPVYIRIWRHKDGTWFTSDPCCIVAFELTERVETLDDFPKEANTIDADGTVYGDPIQVRTPQVLMGVYGPADIGFKGWAVHYRGSGASHYMILNMQRFAEHIKFTNANFTSSGCIVPVTVEDYWHGEDPSVWTVKVDASHLNCSCLGDDMTGIAVFDELSSAYPNLIYRVVDVDQLLQVANVPDCDSNPCVPGTPTRTLLIGDGLVMEERSCGPTAPCAKVIKWMGLEAIGTECDQTSPPGDGTNIQKIVFEAPLELTTEGLCPVVGKVKLADNFITGEGDSCITLNVTESNCKYHISATFNPDCIDAPSVTVIGGTCISVDAGQDEQGGTTYTVNNTMTLTAGTCISIDGDACDKTINNTMTLVAGDYISIAGDGCEKTISNTMEFEAGDCISINENGGRFTIGNTMDVVGGDGIRVAKNGCTYSVSLMVVPPTPRHHYGCSVMLTSRCLQSRLPVSRVLVVGVSMSLGAN